MGQKMDPHGLRVGVIKDWSSKWYADSKNFGEYLVEDNKIRKYIKKKLNSMQKEGYIDAKMDASENFTQSKIMMNVVGGGIAIIFIFIGLLNFINVMITNVSTRLRELAIMESVGMTKKQIKKMLTYEGLYYAGITLGMIFTLGLGIIYVIAADIAGFSAGLAAGLPAAGT